jgi:hypothetical protein
MIDEKRFALGVEDPPKKEVLRIEDPEEIKKVILEDFESKAVFVAHQIDGLPCRPVDSTGFLVTSFTLFGLLSLLGLQEIDQDDKVWVAIDSLAARRQIKIFRLEISSSLSHLDILCRHAEIGRAVCGPQPPFTYPQLIFKEFYWQRPLSKKEFEGAIASPSAKVREVREERDKFFRARFGWRDFALENRLHREDVMETARLKAALLKIASRANNDQKGEP